MLFLCCLSARLFFEIINFYLPAVWMEKNTASAAHSLSARWDENVPQLRV
jgi:hypothetical protein